MIREDPPCRPPTPIPSGLHWENLPPKCRLQCTEDSWSPSNTFGRVVYRHVPSRNPYSKASVAWYRRRPLDSTYKLQSSKSDRRHAYPRISLADRPGNIAGSAHMQRQIPAQNVMTSMRPYVISQGRTAEKKVRFLLPYAQKSQKSNTDLMEKFEQLRIKNRQLRNIKCIDCEQKLECNRCNSI